MSMPSAQRLVVVGNGFDLAHGIKSGYPDFLNFLLRSGASDFVKSMTKYIDDTLLWSNFEIALGELDYDEALEDYDGFLVSYSAEEWRDSMHHDYQQMVAMKLKFASEIPKRLAAWIGSLKTNVVPTYPTALISKDYIYLCFNYTDTLEKTYLIDHKAIKYIHGCYKTGDALVLGHHGNLPYSEDYFKHDTGEDLRIIEAKKIVRSYFKDTFKNTLDVIVKERSFFDSLADIPEILIIGHSFSPVDMDYFEALRSRVSNDCLWKLYYYTDDDSCGARHLVRVLSIPNYEISDVREI